MHLSKTHKDNVALIDDIRDIIYSLSLKSFHQGKGRETERENRGSEVETKKKGIILNVTQSIF